MTAWRDRSREYRVAVGWFVIPALALALGPPLLWALGVCLFDCDAAFSAAMFAPVLGLGWAVAGVIYLGFARSLSVGSRCWLFAGCLAASLVSLAQIWFWGFEAPHIFP